ncbi:MAG: preprotein translocase subunit YajC [Actinomycetota bacterium]
MKSVNLLFVVLLFGLLYFTLIVPQKRRVREHERLVSSLVPGDEVVTIGGIVGKVIRLDDETIWLEVAEGTVLRVIRRAVSKKVSTPERELEEARGVDDTE